MQETELLNLLLLYVDALRSGKKWQESVFSCGYIGLNMYLYRKSISGRISMAKVIMLLPLAISE